MKIRHKKRILYRVLKVRPRYPRDDGPLTAEQHAWLRAHAVLPRGRLVSRKEFDFMHGRRGPVLLRLSDGSVIRNT